MLAHRSIITGTDIITTVIITAGGGMGTASAAGDNFAAKSHGHIRPGLFLGHCTAWI